MWIINPCAAKGQRKLLTDNKLIIGLIREIREIRGLN